jgi:hypothetical protein
MRHLQGAEVDTQDLTLPEADCRSSARLTSPPKT